MENSIKSNNQKKNIKALKNTKQFIYVQNKKKEKLLPTPENLLIMES